MYQITEFDDRPTLDVSFAEKVAQILTASIAKKGKASIAVSGGSTPKGFFNALSHKEIAWDKVTITLADERWVDENSDASNTRLVKKNLLQNNASKANFFNFKIADKLNKATLEQLNKQAELLLSLDVLILGMGEDGHTASLFPCSEQINEALSLTNSDALISVQPKTAPHQRLTFSLAALLQSKNVFLHLCGESKKQVLKDALADDNALIMPIRAFLHSPTVTTKIMYAN